MLLYDAFREIAEALNKEGIQAVITVFEPAHLPPLTRKGVSVELHTRLHGEA